MLAFVTTAKPFRGHSALIRRNALQSWKLLHPDVEVTQHHSRNRLINARCFHYVLLYPHPKSSGRARCSECQ
jgi:hypothetical protein